MKGITKLSDGRIIVDPTPMSNKNVLEKVREELMQLDEIYSEMRENGDSDMRTVMMYLGLSMEKIENIDY